MKFAYGNNFNVNDLHTFAMLLKHDLIQENCLYILPQTEISGFFG